MCSAHRCRNTAEPPNMGAGTEPWSFERTEQQAFLAQRQIVLQSPKSGFFASLSSWSFVITGPHLIQQVGFVFQLSGPCCVDHSDLAQIAGVALPSLQSADLRRHTSLKVVLAIPFFVIAPEQTQLSQARCFLHLCFSALLQQGNWLEQFAGYRGSFVLLLFFPGAWVGKRGFHSSLDLMIFSPA